MNTAINPAMPQFHSTESRLRRDRRLFCLCVALVTAFLISITYGDQTVGFLSDDAMYLLIAEMYSPWPIQKNDTVLAFIRSEYPFPPVYPFYLMLFGSHSQTPVLAASVTVMSLATALCLFGLWIRREQQSTAQALLLMSLLCLTPATLLLSQGLWSEFLFMCFLYAALFIVAAESSSRNSLLLAALMLALASLTRSIGVVFLAAFMLYVIVNRRPNRLLLISVSLLPFIIWNLSRSITGDNAAYWEIIVNLFSAETSTDMGPGFISKTDMIIRGLYWQFTGVEDARALPTSHLIGIWLFMLLAAPGFWQRLLKRKLDAFALPIYLFTVIIWPYESIYFVSRFLYPVFPLLLFYAATSCNGLHITALNRIVIVATAMLTVFLCFTSSSQLIQRAYTDMGEELNDFRRSRTWLKTLSIDAATTEAKTSREVLNIYRRLTSMVPQNECVYAFQTPLVMLHAGRMAKSMPEPNSSKREFDFRMSYCRFILATALTDNEGVYPPYYPMQRLPDNDNYSVTPIYFDSAFKQRPQVFLIEQHTPPGG